MHSGSIAGMPEREDMDMKKIAAIAALAALLVVLLLAIFAFGGKEEPVPETVATTGETTIPTTEATIPGLEDSIFEDEPEETTKATQAAEETKPTQPKPTEPKPTQPKPTEPKPTQPKPTEPEPIDPQPDTPKPNVPKPTEPKPTEPKPTEPKPTEPKPTEPEPTESKPTDGDAVAEFEWFQNLSPSEQQKYMESFDSIDAFFTWYNAAREAYEKDNQVIEVDGGAIDIGAIIESKG